MDGLAGYTSSSSEDGEKGQKNTQNKALDKPYTSQTMDAAHSSETKKRQRYPSPYSPTSPTKMAKADQDCSEAQPTFTDPGNDSNKDTNNYRNRSPNSTHARFFESSEVDAGLKAQLTSLLGKVDELLSNQEKVLKNQERLLSLLDPNQKSTVTDNSKHQTIRVLTPSAAQVLNINNISAPAQVVPKQTGSESEVSFAEFKIPPLPAENIPFTCINSVLPSQTIAKSQDTVLKNNSQNEETLPSPQAQQAKLFQEITLPADFQLESSGNEIEILSKDDAPFLNEGDSDRMKDLLWWAQKIKSKSCSIGNFATNLVKLLFTKEELQNKNCSGTRGKSALDPDKLAFVKYCTFRLYSKYDSFEQDNIWRKKCIVSIDEFLRRGNRTRANSRTVSQEGSVEDEDKNESKDGGELKSAALEYSEQQETTENDHLHPTVTVSNMVSVVNTVS